MSSTVTVFDRLGGVGRSLVGMVAGSGAIDTQLRSIQV